MCELSVPPGRKHDNLRTTSECSPAETQYGKCVPEDGDCGEGLREATCKDRTDKIRCKIPCNWKKGIRKTPEHNLSDHRSLSDTLDTWTRPGGAIRQNKHQGAAAPKRFLHEFIWWHLKKKKSEKSHKNTKNLWHHQLSEKLAPLFVGVSISWSGGSRCCYTLTSCCSVKTTKLQPATSQSGWSLSITRYLWQTECDLSTPTCYLR